MTEALTSTVVVLSRGGRATLHGVCEAILRCAPPPTAVKLIWSGAAAAVPRLPSAIVVRTIEPAAFDHGGTRQLALEECLTDLLVLLSDDAEPMRPDWLAALARPLADPQVVAVYGRHVARPGASVAERIFREVRYPTASRTMALGDLSAGRELVLPISDANAAYRVSAIRALGGFPQRCAYGEDRVLTGAAMAAGWTVYYAGDAAVWHSHEPSWGEMFRLGRYAGALSRSLEIASRSRARGSLYHGSVFAWRMLRAGWELAGLPGVLSVLAASVTQGLGYAAGRVLSGRPN